MADRTKALQEAIKALERLAVVEDEEKNLPPEELLPSMVEVANLDELAAALTKAIGREVTVKNLTEIPSVDLQPIVTAIERVGRLTTSELQSVLKAMDRSEHDAALLRSLASQINTAFESATEQMVREILAAKLRVMFGDELPKFQLVDEKGKLIDPSKLAPKYYGGGGYPAVQLKDKDGNLVNLTSRTIGDGRKLVTTAGTRVALGGDVPCRRVHITALVGNTGTVVVGSSTVVASAATRQGVPLMPLSSITLEVKNLNLVYLDSEQNNEGVSYLYEV